jgi:ferredoxin
MEDKVRLHCKELLTGKKVDAIWGLREKGGLVAPFLFQNPEELDSLVVSAKYPLSFTCRPAKETIISILQKKKPGLRLGVVARGCDERALVELAKGEQINLDQIDVIGLACDQAQAEECFCFMPYPQKHLFGAKVEGIPEEKAFHDLLAKELKERLNFWQGQLSKCIKCYGCRNACPMCFCKDCRMEQSVYTQTGWLPPEFPLFHFVRFYHMADRCIECGECEKACPMDIPLRKITKYLRARMKEIFDYRAGLDAKEKSPILTTLDEDPVKEFQDEIR